MSVALYRTKGKCNTLRHTRLYCLSRLYFISCWIQTLQWLRQNNCTYWLAPGCATGCLYCEQRDTYTVNLQSLVVSSCSPVLTLWNSRCGWEQLKKGKTIIYIYIYIYIYIWYGRTQLYDYYIRLYSATYFGLITRPSSSWSLSRCSVQLYMLSIYEIYNCTLHLLKDQPEDGFCN